MAEDPPPIPYVEVEIVGPTEEQREAVLAEINQFAPGWQATPAYLIIKPEYGLIVSLDHIEQDESEFVLVLKVEEAIIAPADFDRKEPMRLSCGWNQPYLSLGATTISAPYSFRLLFGAEGVRNIREYAATRNIDTLRVPPSPETLGSCFSPLFKLPDDPPPAPAMRAYWCSKSEATQPRCPSICKKREKCFSNGWQRNKRISAPG